MIKYPDAFLARMKAQLNGEFDSFLSALGQVPSTSVRLNPGKPCTDGLFSDNGGLGERVPWSVNGFYLNQRPSFTFDPLFHAGAYYVQESSSMFIEQAFRSAVLNDTPIRVLDLCAAPGGKSTHLLALLNRQSLLVANEVIANRNYILRQNLARWGKANIIVTQNKASDFGRLTDFFDLVLVDAPCSGEGLFRKDKAAVQEWSEENVHMCALRQKDILRDILPCLKPGGHLIYSTCTFEDSENLGNIQRLIQEEGMECLKIAGAESFSAFAAKLTRGPATGYAFYPHRNKGEGFFISLLRKPGALLPNTMPAFKAKQPEGTDSELAALLEPFLSEPGQYAFIKHQTVYHLLPAPLLSDLKLLTKQLYLRCAGLPVGEIKGKDLVPSQELALFSGLRNDFPSAELDLKTAVTYLRAETISLPDLRPGWLTLRYKGMNLGFGKALPNRMNNYFPKDWRILKAGP